jgi:receptor-type tyrosine-protein phosphatase gamma
MGHVVYLLVAISGIVAAELTTEYDTTLGPDKEGILMLFMLICPSNLPDSRLCNSNLMTHLLFPVPSKPQHLTVLDVSSVTITLRWTQPDKLNGAIEGYRVYYMFNNYTDMNRDKIKHVSPYITYNLTNLKPYTEYKIWVKAYTRNHEGEPSDPIYNSTDISGPSAPRILNLTCQTQDNIFFQWARPNHFYFSIDYYYIYIKLNNRIWKNFTIETSKEHLETSVSVKVT